MPVTGALSVTVRCRVCGSVPCATMEEAEKRAERHARITGHPAVVEAVRAA